MSKGGGFVPTYVEYLASRTDAPPVWFVHAALSTLAVAAGNDFWTPDRGDNLYPNLWVVLIGDSGTGKSVPLAVSKRLLQKADLRRRIAADTFSMEGLVSSLKDQPVSLIVQGEFSAFLQNISKEYNSGLTEWLTDLYDCPPYVERRLAPTRSKAGVMQPNIITIEKPAVSLLAASTPAWFTQQFTSNNLRGGFFGRIVFAAGGKSGAYVGDPGPMDEDVEMELAAHLNTLADQPGGMMDFSAVRDQFIGWERERRESLATCPPDLRALRSRNGALAKKAAMLFCLSRDPYTKTVTKGDMTNAINYVQGVSTTAEAFLAAVPQTKEEAELMRLVDIVEREHPIERQHLLKKYRGLAQQMDRLLSTAVQSHRLHSYKENRAEWWTVPTPLNGKVTRVDFTASR